MEQLSREALTRAIKYEEKTRMTEKKIVIECMKEIDRRRTGNKESKWEKKENRNKKSRNEDRRN